MNGSHDHDPLEELRSADPLPLDRVPAASVARVRARVFDDIDRIEMRNRARRASAFRIGAAAAAALAVLVVIALPQRLAPGSTASAQPSASVAVVPTPTTGSGIGMCVEQYSAQTLAHRTIAFDGTVIATHGEDATFRVNTAFRGVTAPGPVTLTATGMTGDAITSVGGPALKVGDRYLVAGEDHFAWACGFTQPWSEQATSAWARVLAP